MRLPQNLSIQDFDNRYRLASDEWREAVHEVCVESGIEFRDFRTFGTDSSNLIASVSGKYVVKIFPPFHRHQWESERRVLAHLGKFDLSLPIPRLIAEGERADGWTYVVITLLPGRPLEEIWPQISRENKASLLNEIGRVMAKVHGTPVGDLKDLDPEWGHFLSGQIERCVARHQRLQMPDWFISEIPASIAGAKNLISSQERVILTGEYTPFNLLVEEGPKGWSLSGMIDFGDAMIGPRDYDFDGPIFFLCEGDPLLIDHLFIGYGVSSPTTDHELRRRLMLILILHRYSNLKYQVRIPKVWERVRSLRDLERAIFSSC